MKTVVVDISIQFLLSRTCCSSSIKISTAIKQYLYICVFVADQRGQGIQEWTK